MPEIVRFYGIIIKMFLADHNPPHIHASYGEYAGLYNIQTIEYIEGDLPKKADAMVREWVELYHKELLKMWHTKTITKLPPLE